MRPWLQKTRSEAHCTLRPTTGEDVFHAVPVTISIGGPDSWWPIRFLHLSLVSGGRLEFLVPYALNKCILNCFDGLETLLQILDDFSCHDQFAALFVQLISSYPIFLSQNFRESDIFLPNHKREDEDGSSKAGFEVWHPDPLNLLCESSEFLFKEYWVLYFKKYRHIDHIEKLLKMQALLRNCLKSQWEYIELLAWTECRENVEG